MKSIEFFKTIISPVSTEKSLTQADARQHVFKVAKNATKPQIREAIKGIFNVAVEKVNILNVKPKSRSFRQVKGTKSGWKKAIVKLAEGNDINMAEFE